MAHEDLQAANVALQYTSPKDNPAAISRSKMYLEAGWLGRCFGTGSNATVNIAGLALVLLFGIGIATMFLQSSLSAAEYWKFAAPLISGIIGFMFGKGKD